MEQDKKFDNEKHLCKCGFCQQYFDMRDLGQVLEHFHNDTPELKHPMYGIVNNQTQ